MLLQVVDEDSGEPNKRNPMAQVTWILAGNLSFKLQCVKRQSKAKL